MTPRALLDGLRQDNPACFAVGYADIVSGLVLVTSAGSELPQEKWDDLCATANSLLKGSSALIAQDTLGLSDPVDYAIVVANQSYVIAVASVHEHDSALCALCDLTLDTACFVASAQSTLAALCNNE